MAGILDTIFYPELSVSYPPPHPPAPTSHALAPPPPPPPPTHHPALSRSASTLPSTPLTHHPAPLAHCPPLDYQL